MTGNNALAVKISRSLDTAMNRNIGRDRKWPPNETLGTAPRTTKERVHMPKELSW